MRNSIRSFLKPIWSRPAKSRLDVRSLPNSRPPKPTRSGCFSGFMEPSRLVVGNRNPCFVVGGLRGGSWAWASADVGADGYFTRSPHFGSERNSPDSPRIAEPRLLEDRGQGPPQACSHTRRPGPSDWISLPLLHPPAQRRGDEHRVPELTPLWDALAT